MATATLTPSKRSGANSGLIAGPRLVANPELRLRRPRRVSPLTWRILAVNALALAILVGGLLHLDQYRAGLLAVKTAALATQAEIIAGAIGEEAVSGAPARIELDIERARRLVPRLVLPTGTRARLFLPAGGLAVDSRRLAAARRDVLSRALPPPEQYGWAKRALNTFYDAVLERLPLQPDLPPYREAETQNANDYAEVVRALGGATSAARRVAADGMVILSVALPVQKFKKVLGALMLSADTADIDESVRAQRLAILQVFAAALAVTVLLSLFLAGTITRPVRRLAQAADRVRSGHGRYVDIPDFTARRDEIGDLSRSLRDMTSALYGRLDAIEAFAADVAHEIKNPLSSVRSAVEAFARTSEPEQRERLAAIMLEDVGRLDRLITDIADASRLDAELSRAAFAEVDVAALIEGLAEAYQATSELGGSKLELAVRDRDRLVVAGLADRIGQVVRNLVGNAVSFIPAGGTIRLTASAGQRMVEIEVEDEGPGVPESDLEAVFNRFYTARPAGEAFGVHSGLGLSISRQIVEAHGGTIRAANVRDPGGRVLGACFTVRLPA